MSKKPTCQTCPYWEKMTSGKNGDCRKGLPSIEIDGSYIRWPITKPDEYCGEHPGFKLWLEDLTISKAIGPHADLFGLVKLINPNSVYPPDKSIYRLGKKEVIAGIECVYLLNSQNEPITFESINRIRANWMFVEEDEDD